MTTCTRYDKTTLMTRKMKSLRFDLLPIQLDRNRGIPLYRQLYDWFRAAIIKGQLTPSQRIPSTRSLAAELAISRVSVLAAFEQLFAEGYLETIVGSGTFVTRSIPDKTWTLSPIQRQPIRVGGHRMVSRFAKAFLDMRERSQWENRGPFRVSQPALDRFPSEIWAKLVTRHAKAETTTSMEYSDPAGYLPLRESIVEYLGTVRGVRCEASQVVMTTGSQQALQIAGRVLLDPGDRVWMEEPGYIGARQALSTTGATFVSIPVDDEGLDVAQGIRRSPTARVAYVTPSHQYPLGMKLSATRRMLLLDWATSNGSWIIEDDYDSEYRFESRPLASLQGLDTDARVIYVGTFSKVLFPALRIGYVIVPKDLIAAFIEVRHATDIFSSTLYQRVLTDFINEGHFGRHVRKMRMLYMERRNVLASALSKNFGNSLKMMVADGGMHVVVLLPEGSDDCALAKKAAKNGIPVLPLSTCYFGTPPKCGFVLGYAGSSVANIRAGVRRLATSLRA